MGRLARRIRSGPAAACALAWALALVCACGPAADPAAPAAAAEGPPKRGGTIRIGLLREPGTFLDWFRNTNVDVLAADLVFRKLARPGSRAGVLEPDLAQTWDFEPDGRSIRFHLRQGHTWEDGRPVTAADVVFSLRRAAEPDSKAGRLPFEHVEAVNASEVLLRFVSSYPYMLQDAAAAHIYPAHLLQDVPRAELGGHRFQREPVGSGPFRLERWEPGQYLSFVARTDAPDGGPYLERIVLRNLAGKEAALREFEGGGVDVMFRVPAEKAQGLRARGFRVFDYPTATFFTVVWNTTRPPWDHPQVRRAMTELVDRSTLARRFGGPHAAVADGPVPPDHAWYTPLDFPAPGADPDSAARRLAQSGWHRGADGAWLDPAGVPVQLELVSTSSNARWRQVTATLADVWRRAGIDVRVTELGGVAYEERREDARFDGLLQVWSHTSGVDLEGCFGAAGVDNVGRLHDAGLEGMLAAFARERDPAAARERFDDARRRIAELQPWSFLFYRGETVATTPAVRGVDTHLIDPVAAAHRWWLAADGP